MIDKIKKIVAYHLDVLESEIKLKSKIVEDLDADSLDIVEIIIDLEDEYGLNITDEEFEKVSTVEDIIKFIESKGK